MADPITLGITAGLAVVNLAIGLLTPKPKVKQDRLKVPEVPNSEYGSPLGVGYGIKALPSTIVWEKTPEIRQISQDSGGGKGRRPSTPPEEVAFLTYCCVFSANRSYGLRRLWLNNKLVLDYSNPNPSNETRKANTEFEKYVQYYDGNPTQPVDPDYVAVAGVNNASALVNYTSIVFRGLPAKDYGNAYPSVLGEFQFNPNGVETSWGVGQGVGIQYVVDISLTRANSGSFNLVAASGSGSGSSGEALISGIRRVLPGAICGVRIVYRSEPYDFPVRGFPAPTFAPPDNYGTVQLITSAGNITIAEGIEYGRGYELPAEATPEFNGVTFGSLAYDFANPTGLDGTASITSVRTADGSPDTYPVQPVCTPFLGSVIKTTRYIPDQNITLKSVVDAELASLGIDTDTDELNNYSIRGWVSQNGTYRDNLEDLLLPFQIEVVPDRSFLRFLGSDRGNPRLIDMEFVGTFAGSQPDEPSYGALSNVVQKKPRSVDVPSIIRFRFDDGLFEDQRGSIVMHRGSGSVFDDNVNIQDVGTRASMDYVTAYGIAYKLAARLTQRTQEITVPLPFAYADVLPGEILQLDYRNTSYPTRVKALSVTVNPDATLKVDGVTYEDLSGLVVPIFDAPLQPPDVSVGALPELRILQIPYIGNQATEDIVYAYLYSEGAPRSAQVSINDGTNTTALGTLTSGVIEGLALNTLNPVSSEQFTMDSLDILVDPSVTIESYERNVILNELYLGMVVVGREIIKYENAIDLGSGNWRLTGLWRGLWGTDTTEHVSSEIVTVWNSSLIRTVSVPNAVHLKNYQVLLNTSTEANVITYQSASRRPYSPTQVNATTNTFGDVILTWQRRSRGWNQNWSAPGLIPLRESSELYRVEIYNGSTLVASANPTTNSYLYSAANQIAGFGSLRARGTNLLVRVFQVGSRPEGIQDLPGFSRFEFVVVQ